jgi:hypothetical protein
MLRLDEKRESKSDLSSHAAGVLFWMTVKAV